MRAVIWKAVSSKVQTKDDKISLPFQEEIGLAWAAQHGHEIVAVLTVPGLSRSEADILTMLEEYEREGVTAYHDLRRMWYERSFDVLWAYSFDRLGRSGTLIHYVGENTIKKGMSIFLHEDGGYMTEEDFRYKLSMASIMVVSPLEAFRKKTHEAKNRLAENGLPPNANPCMSHRVVRDPRTGRASYLELDPQYERLWQDLAKLLLEGVSWHDMERELFEQFGHTNPRTGKAWNLNRMYSCVTNPCFWGNQARQHRHKRSKQRDERGYAGFGEWVLEAGHIAPPGVRVWYETHPPVWTGEQAERLKTELRRRQSTRGGSRPHKTHAFSSLLVCQECNYMMYNYSSRKYPGMKCCSHWQTSITRSSCSQRKTVPIRVIAAEVKRILEGMVERNSPELGVVDTGASSRIRLLEVDMAAAEKRLRGLIRDKAAVDGKLAAMYDQEISSTNGQLTSLQRQRDDALRETEGHRPAEQQRAFRQLKMMGVGGFFQQTDTQQNQMLHSLLNGWKLLARDGNITGLTFHPKRFRRTI